MDKSKMTATMMEEHIKKTLECAICHEIWKQPKQLTCSHIFCLVCIDTSFHTSRVGSYNGFPCPECRTETVISTAGAQELRDAPYSLKYIIGYLKNNNEDSAALKCMYDEIKKAEKSLKCPHHPDEKVAFLCNCYETPLCELCQDDHKDHETVFLDDVIDGMKKMRKDVDEKINQIHSEEIHATECLKALDISKTITSSTLEARFQKVKRNKEALEKILEESYKEDKSKMKRDKDTLSEAFKCAKDISESISKLQLFGLDGHTLLSWKELHTKYEKLNDIRPANTKMKKCVYRFLYENPKHLKLGSIDKIKAHDDCELYGIMEQEGGMYTSKPKPKPRRPRRVSEKQPTEEEYEQFEQEPLEAEALDSRPGEEEQEPKLEDEEPCRRHVPSMTGNFDECSTEREPKPEDEEPCRRHVPSMTGHFDECSKEREIEDPSRIIQSTNLRRDDSDEDIEDPPPIPPRTYPQKVFSDEDAYSQEIYTDETYLPLGATYTEKESASGTVYRLDVSSEDDYDAWDMLNPEDGLVSEIYGKESTSGTVYRLDVSPEDDYGDGLPSEIYAPPLPRRPRLPPPSFTTYSTGATGGHKVENEMIVSGGTILKKDLLMLCSFKENKVRIVNLKDRRFIEKEVEGVWDATPGPLSQKFAFVSKLPKAQKGVRKDKKGKACIMKINYDCKEIGVFTRDVKLPSGITFSDKQRLLYVCEPNERKILLFSTTTGERLRSVKNDKFQSPWFVCISTSGYGIYVSDFEAMSVFHIRNESDIEVYKVSTEQTFCPGLCVCCRGKWFVCDQINRKIKASPKSGRTLCDEKECSYRPLLILRNGDEDNTLVIVSNYGEIEHFQV